MFSSKNKKRMAAGLVAVGLGAGAMAGSAASADPAQYSALVGVGSDTTQDVTNAFAGRSGNRLFTPLVSSAATGAQQIISFDATGPGSTIGDCIVLKPGGGAFTRPNGSSNGRRALSRAFDSAPNTKWGDATCGLQDISGNVDFARSSSGPSGSGTALVHIPFGKDAVSFAAYRAAGSPVTTLTRAQVKTIFETGSFTTAGGVKIIPCGIQTGSGTFSFWQGKHGATAGQEDTSTTVCRNAVSAAGIPGTTGGRLQENDGVQLKAAGDAVAALPGEANTQVIVGFSAGAFIAKSNGLGQPQPPATVFIGGISDDNVNGGGADLGFPATGTAPNLTPVASFYNSYLGRDIYNVLHSSVVDDPVDSAAKSLFVGPTSAVCSASGTLATFGFLPVANCGATTTRGPLLSGTVNS